MSRRIVVDHRGSPAVATRRRTLAAMGWTLATSGRVLGSASLGRLDRASLDARVRRWARRVFDVSRTSLAVRGPHVDPGPCVLLSNHTSLLDVPAVVLTFPGRVTFVAKQELRSVPLFGAAMETYGIVFVERTQRAKAIRQLDAAKAALGEGTSVWIAAAGGRSRDGALGPLKKGAFHLAIQLQVPLVPTWIDGTLDVIPPGALASVSGQMVEVRYGAPISTLGLRADDVPALRERSRDALLALV